VFRHEDLEGEKVEKSDRDGTLALMVLFDNFLIGGLRFAESLTGTFWEVAVMGLR